MLIFVATAGAARFFRAGMEFTKAGRVIDAKALAEGVLERLKAEPHLHLREPTEVEVADYLGATAGPASEIDPHDLLLAAIPALPASAYGKNGLPTLAPVRAALPDVPEGEITKEAVTAAFDELVKGGFKAPVTNP